MNLHRPKRYEGITEQKLGEETLVYTSESESVHVLNKTAGFIWALCDGKRSLAQIEDEIRHNYQLKPEHNLEDDLTKILDDLTAKGLIQWDFK